MYLIKGNKFTIHRVVHFIQLYHMNVEFFNVQIKTKTLFLVVNFNSIYDFIQIVLNGNRWNFNFLKIWHRQMYINEKR